MESLYYNIKAKNFKAKKSLGQNFLIDPETIDFISNFANCDDEILEIGAGLGFVTKKLLQKAKKVVSLEIDKDAINILKKELKDYDNFNLIEKDILKTSLDELPFEKEKIKVIANIPYYITSPIIVHLLGEINDYNHKNRKKIESILLMVQKEVAQRIVADENSPSKEYGKLSILAQMWADVKIVKFVPKNCFNPMPKVDSALVEFKLNDAPKVEISPYLKKTVDSIFNQRRKNIKNSLVVGGFINPKEALEMANITIETRGEKLSIEKINELAKYLKRNDNNEN